MKRCSFLLVLASVNLLGLIACTHQEVIHPQDRSAIGKRRVSSGNAALTGDDAGEVIRQSRLQHPTYGINRREVIIIRDKGGVRD